MSKRIVVVGTSGSGKSTLAKEIGLKLGLPHIELDDLYWQPNWGQCSKEELESKVIELIQGDAWVMDGNYGDLREVVWSRATTLIWLDYPFIWCFTEPLKEAFVALKTKKKSAVLITKPIVDFSQNSPFSCGSSRLTGVVKSNFLIIQIFLSTII